MNSWGPETAACAAPPVFVARWPWLGGDLQTLRNTLRRPRIHLASHGTIRLEIDARDGTGDRLLALLDRPTAPRQGAACIVLVHGLTGCSDSAYVRVSAANLLVLGHDVLRVNLRGAGPGRALATRHYNAGSSADLAAVLRGLPDFLRDQPIAAIGYSLGANILLKFLGETNGVERVAAAASVSAPIDLASASRRIRAPRNRLYHRYLLRRMKSEALAAPGPMSQAHRAIIRDVDDVLAFDDQVVAPAAGCRDADDYYARCSGMAFLADIRTPTLMLHAGDDPWIPHDAYRAIDWPALPSIVPLFSRGGGHVGFHGRGDIVPWHDRAIAWFLRRQGLSPDVGHVDRQETAV